MRHKVYGKKLSRSTDERKRLRRNLLRSLIVYGQIQTTKAKAQAIRGAIDILITKAKKQTEAMKRHIIASLGDRKIAKQLIDMANQKFSDRSSGYTRMIKLGFRQGDAAEMVLLSFVQGPITTALQEEPEEEIKESDESKKKIEKKQQKQSTKRSTEKKKKTQVKNKHNLDIINDL